MDISSTKVDFINDVTISGSVDIVDGTVASSSTTGALKVAGGISTQDNLYVGGNLVVSGATTATIEIDEVELTSGLEAMPSLTFQEGPTSGISFQNAIGDWTERIKPSGNNTEWKKALWLPTGYFVISGDGSGLDDREYIARSSDGINWTTNSSIPATAVSNLECRGMAYSTKLGRLIAVGNSNDVLYSDDSGDNWANSNGVLSQSNDWEGACYSEDLDLFVITASNGTNRVATSTNGVSWTLSNASSARTWRQVIWASGHGVFIATNTTGSSTDGIMTSPDGVNWTNRSTQSGLAYFGIAHSPELNKTIAFTSTTTAQVTTDGTTWTDLSVPDIDSCVDAIWTGNMFFVCGLNGKYMYSYDGIFWVEDITTETDDYYSCAHSPTLGMFLMVGLDNPIITTANDLSRVNITSSGSNKLSVDTRWSNLNLFSESIDVTVTLTTSPITISPTFHFQRINDVIYVSWDNYDISYSGAATLNSIAGEIPDGFRPTNSGTVSPIRVREDTTIKLGIIQFHADGHINIQDSISSGSNSFTSRFCMWGSGASYKAG